MGRGSVIAELNLHEVVRAAVAAARVAHPERLVDVEHRGDGDGDGDADAMASALQQLFAAVLANATGDAAVWVRSSAVAADFVVLVEYEGAAVAMPPLEGTIAALEGRLTADGSRLRVELPRHA